MARSVDERTRRQYPRRRALVLRDPTGGQLTLDEVEIRLGDFRLQIERLAGMLGVEDVAVRRHARGRAIRILDDPSVRLCTVGAGTCHGPAGRPLKSYGVRRLRLIERIRAFIRGDMDNVASSASRTSNSGKASIWPVSYMRGQSGRETESRP